MVKDENLICRKLHEKLNLLDRHYFPFDEKKLPKNGIYFLFEKGEKAHEGDRIVRIGTHTGKDQLPSRLIQHFMNENKDRSIFRKNIGRAILSKKKDEFIRDWEIDRTTKDVRESFSIDEKKLKETEKEVTKYIQENFSFAVIPIDDAEERLKTESKIISTISLCDECGPSKNWLGRFSPKEKIRKSGLWLVNELWKKPLNQEESENLIRID